MARDGQHAAPAEADATERLYRRISLRVLPLFLCCIALNYLDRTALSFAAIQMTSALGFSSEVLGLAGGLFFGSYCLAQVPSSVLCMRVGVRWWLTSLLLAWGLVACLFAAVRTPGQFYALRLLLGLTEAGSFPGVWYGISLWFTPERSSLPFALVNTSVAVSQVLAAPIAAALLQLDGVGGLAGWQWVFVGEGLPPIVLALALPWLLPNSPDDTQGPARFLTPEELCLLKADRAASLTRLSLTAASAAPRAPSCDDAGSFSLEVASSRSPLQPPSGNKGGPEPAALRLRGSSVIAQAAAAGAAPPSTLAAFLQVIRVWQVWYMALAEALKVSGVMAQMLFLPIMIQSLLSGGDPTQLVAASTGDSHGGSTGTLPVLLSAIPFSCAAVLTTALGAAAQHTGHALVYYWSCACVGGAAFAAFPLLVRQSRVIGFCMLTVALAAGYASSPQLPAAITQLLAARAARTAAEAAGGAASHQADAQAACASALALPLYNSVAMLGGFAGPWLLGILLERSGGFSSGAFVFGACQLAAGGMILLLWWLQRRVSGHSCAAAVRHAPLMELAAGRPRSVSRGHSSSGGGGSRPRGVLRSHSSGRLKPEHAHEQQQLLAAAADGTDGGGAAAAAAAAASDAVVWQHSHDGSSVSSSAQALHRHRPGS